LAIEKIFLNQEHFDNGQKTNAQIFKSSKCAIASIDYFFSGQEIIMTYSVPHYQKPLRVTGEIVWSSQNGIGIKFSQLSPHQTETIKSFSENLEKVYEIAS
jgi:Tfp pilus assembly protein PilZ